MSANHLVIAIDGPAASGKGTLARNLAKHLNFAYLDTGSLYRAVAFEILQAGGDPENEDDALKGVVALTERIENSDPASPDFILHSQILRGEDIAIAASKVAAQGEARKRLVILQRHFAESPGENYQGAILDGRDIGTVICPEADVKLFVMADLEIRAERRLKELQSKGIEATKSAVLDDMRERDARDKARKASPLKPAGDAITLDTSLLSESEVLEKALEIIEEKITGPTTS